MMNADTAREVRRVLRGLAVTTTAARDLPEVGDAACILDDYAAGVLYGAATTSTRVLPPSWHQAAYRRRRASALLAERYPHRQEG